MTDTTFDDTNTTFDSDLRTFDEGEQGAMKIHVVVSHPTKRTDESDLAPGDLVGWRIKWNGPGSLGAYYPEPMQLMAETIAETSSVLTGVEGDHYTVAIEWFDAFGQKSIKVLDTVTLHVDEDMPAAPKPGDGVATVLPS